MYTILELASRPPAFNSTPPSGLPYFEVFAIGVAVLLFGIAIGRWAHRQETDRDDLQLLRKLKRDGKWPLNEEPAVKPAETFADASPQLPPASLIKESATVVVPPQAAASEQPTPPQDPSPTMAHPGEHDMQAPTEPEPDLGTEGLTPPPMEGDGR